MDVDFLTAEREHAYETFVQKQDEALIYYSLTYRNLLLRMGIGRARYLVATRDGQVEGCLPLMERDGPFGRVINSLPYFGSHGGPLASGPDAARSLWERYAELSQEAGVAASTVILHPFRPVPPDTPFHTHEDGRLGFVTPLSNEGGGDLLSRIESSARRNITKAEACGVRVIVDNERFAFLEAVHRENMQAIGGRSKRPLFFRSIQDMLRPGADYDLYVAEKDGEPVAALLILYCGETVEYFVPAIKAAFRSEQPLAPILWRAMQDAAGRGFRRWNWGGSWPSQLSLQRFKRKWGGEPVPYRYLVRINNPELLRSTPMELARDYPDFFVTPYSLLQTNGEDAHG